MHKTNGTTRLLFIALVFAGTPVHGGGWIPLFDGQSFAGWTTQAGDPVTAEAWEVVDGTIHLDTSEVRGGNIITDREYGDFELLFEWKISERGNNGIKYRVNDFDGRVLGLEYQIIDDEGNKNLRPNQMTGSIYDVYEPRSHGVLKPVGEFNRGRIVVLGNRIEHWLNGHLVVHATAGDAEWEERIGNSKFSDKDGFGRNRLGRIMLTDHKDEVWYRNIFLRPLSTDQHLASLEADQDSSVVSSPRLDCCCDRCCQYQIRLPPQKCRLLRQRWRD